MKKVISFFGLPFLFGYLTVGKGPYPEPVIIQWLAGFFCMGVLALILLLFAGFMGWAK